MSIESITPEDPPRIGPYRLLGVLGTGPGFRTFLGVGPDGGVYVLQRVGAPLLSEPDFRARWRANAVASMRVGGPGNPTVIDVDSEDENPWRSSVFVPAISLDSIVARHRALPVPAVRALAAGLAAALDSVHAAGLVHRRVRPDTVGLTRDSVRLAEIGIPPPPGMPPLDTPYLAPEQRHGYDPAPAADVYSLGAVLVYAATGESPAADLRSVPAPLHDLIAACLRPDPGARPTPAQILRGLGNPTAVSWPTSVLNAIDEQEQQVHQLVAAQPTVTTAGAAPAVGVRLSEALSRTTESGTAGVRSMRRRLSRTRPLIRIAAGVAALILLAATATAIAVTRDDPAPSTEPAPVPGISLDQLRRTDACAWLTTALGDSFPASPATLPKSAWKLAETPSWGCLAASSGYELELTLGQHLTGFTPQQSFVDGIAVRTGAAPRCSRSIAAAAPDTTSGITLELRQPATVKNCTPIDPIATTLARTLTTAPTSPRPTTSFATLTPCSLVTREAVTKTIGPTPLQPSISDAHSCVWDGGVEATIRLSRTGTYTPTPAETKIVEGVRMYLDTPDVTTTCTREYLDPTTNTETLAVIISWIDSTREMNCPMAEVILRAAVARLPTR
ncbi:hypothetical protein LTV02_15885 [Nocardia yamanashiensis]|uniref:serine/threonine protein kinase n=1 Tax=Nocardia yamanashiensis TaxID=209247 RepID=UPI001E38017D|nr:hypothetical protein [Nocardia yamanashiensis]UGT46067.1 hypothetical protein LTV02_15885 [Nocardia yamanashiensis]